jgi:hypothetical protein
MSPGTQPRSPGVAHAPAPVTGVAAGVASAARAPAPVPAVEVGWRASDVLGRIGAMLLLPLSIFPVLLLGPSVLRAPVALAHEGWGDVQHLERRLDPERPYRPSSPPAPGPSVWQAQVSLGPVYGRWNELPGAGGQGITWTGTR